MRLSMAVLIFALVLVPAATEAESEKKEGVKVELMLDMSIEEVKALKGKPRTQVNLDTTTVLSYDDIKLIFRDNKLAGERWQSFSPLYMPLIAQEEMIMRWGGISSEEFKKTHTIPSVRFRRADPETTELVLGMSIEEVEELTGKLNPISIEVGGSIQTKATGLFTYSLSLPKGSFLLYTYDGMTIMFRNDKLFSVR